MFISLIRYGRLTNRLFLLAHLIALAKECNQNLFDLSLMEYCFPFNSQYTLTNTSVNIVSSRLFSRFYIPLYPLVIKLCHIYSIFQHRLPFLKSFCEVVSFASSFPENLPEDSQQARHAVVKSLDSLAASGILSSTFKLYIFCDWYVRAPAVFQKHRLYSLRCLQPSPEIVQKSAELVDMLICNSDLLIGIVIRREDYQSYAGGRFFFPMLAYREIADRFCALFHGKSIKFFFCSVSHESMDCMEGLDYFYRPFYPIENLQVLSSCHYILSPPSTYAMWASLVGNVPLYLTSDPSFPFTIDDFKVQKS